MKEQAVLYVRIPQTIKTEISELATSYGWSQSRITSILLAEALRNSDIKKNMESYNALMLRLGING